MQKKILFVDDEPRVIEGLGRMLRPMRHEWSMCFAQSGQQALEILERETFDVVVTDMRMPGMDGAQLLTKVKEKYPSVVRIILSGQSDRELILQSVRPVHQYLSKPCDAETLKVTVERAFSLRELLAEDSLKQVVSKMDSIPSIPSIYAELTEELRSPDASIQKVGDLISRDMGMTAKILQLVNSAFFGLPRHVSSPAEASSLLGLDAIEALALSVQIFSQFDNGKVSQEMMDHLWRHSLVTGLFAKEIAGAESQDQMMIDTAYMAGLIHDAGKLVLADNFPQEYEQALCLSKDENIGLLEAEREVLGTSHDGVGAYLMRLWGLPESIVEALMFHHDVRSYHLRGFSPVLAVHIANALEHEENGSGWFSSPLDGGLLSAMNITERLSSWRGLCRQVIQRGGSDDE